MISTGRVIGATGGSSFSRIPPWIKRNLPYQKDYFLTQSILARHELNTVCQGAKCPNIWECWSRRTATFMILGNVCTRACGFCAVGGGPSAATPSRVDLLEPDRIAKAVLALGLRYVVITSVTRDDLEDQGAAHFRDTIQAIRTRCPQTRIEILTPDFRGQRWCLEIIMRANPPDVYSHNMETVSRLYGTVRPGASYQRSLAILEAAKIAGNGIPTKSGIMVGLGETAREVLEVLRDLRQRGVDAVTIGQYLKPSQYHRDIVQYRTLSFFAVMEDEARRMGFSDVRSEPMVRSSYRADAMFLGR